MAPRKPKAENREEPAPETEQLVLSPDLILIAPDVPEVPETEETPEVIDVEEITAVTTPPVDETLAGPPIEEWGVLVAPRDMVMFVLDRGPAKGESRPAIVTKVCDQETGTVQLQVFTDSDPEGRFNDRIACPYWATSVRYDHRGIVPYTWHWDD